MLHGFIKILTLHRSRGQKIVVSDVLGKRLVFAIARTACCYQRFVYHSNKIQGPYYQLVDSKISFFNVLSICSSQKVTG